MRAKFSVVAVIATAFAMSVAGVASASAAEFNASKAGLLSAKVVAGAAGKQVFKTSAGNVECTALTAEGKIAEGKKQTQNATVKYENCTAFGDEATVSLAEYEFNANGSVKVLKAITVEAEVEGVTECTVTVPAQTILDDEINPANGVFQEGVEYANLSGKMKLIPEPVEGIESEGKGKICEYNELGAAAKGTYTGESEVTNSGGSIEIVGTQP